MKMKNLVLVAAVVCFVAANASSALVDVATTADTYIQYNRTEQDGVTGPVDENYGGQSSFITEARVDRFRKAYLQFDASAYASGDIASIESISVYYTGSRQKEVGVWLLLPDQGIDDNWTETDLTWVNAPYNDAGAYTDRSFNNNGAAGESVDDLSSGGNGWIMNTGWNTFTFDHLDTTRYETLLAALTTGDQKVTFGLSQDDGKVADMLSREYVDDGTYGTAGDSLAPYITIVTSGPLEGDLNDDGFVGSADLDIVRSAWGQTVEAGCLTCGDPSGDGMVNSADLDIVRANWGVTSAAAVPEPCLVALFAAAFVLLPARRQR